MRSFVVTLLMAGLLATGARAQGPVRREPTLEKTTVGSELFRASLTRWRTYEVVHRLFHPRTHRRVRRRSVQFAVGVRKVVEA